MDDLETAAHARVGQILRGKWRLDNVLGVGGMATVYGATHRNGMRGAVKMLHAELARNADARERFLREGYVANRLERGAVKVLDDDATEDGTVFLVMELLEGHTLEAMTAKRPSRTLSQREVAALMIQLLDTLSLAHAAGIVHRDIKPENLFLTNQGELRVLDFGIARLRDHAGGGARVTRTQTAMGTPAFMPPEQALGHWEAVGPHSDIYSVGATMFMLLTGQMTHEARNAAELVVTVATRPARPIETILPGISPELAALVNRALAFSPADRYAEAQTMKGALLMVARSLAVDDPNLERRLTTSTPGAARLGAGADATLASGELPAAHHASNAVRVMTPFDDPLASTTQAGALTRSASGTTSPVSSESPTDRLPRARSNRQVLLFAGLGLGLFTATAAVGAWTVFEKLHAPASHGSAPDRTDGSSAVATMDSTRGPATTSNIPVTPGTAVASASVASPASEIPSASPAATASASASPSVAHVPSALPTSATPTKGGSHAQAQPERPKTAPTTAPTIDLNRAD